MNKRKKRTYCRDYLGRFAPINPLILAAVEAIELEEFVKSIPMMKRTMRKGFYANSKINQGAPVQ